MVGGHIVFTFYVQISIDKNKIGSEELYSSQSLM